MKTKSSSLMTITLCLSLSYPLLSYELVSQKTTISRGCEGRVVYETSVSGFITDPEFSSHAPAPLTEEERAERNRKSATIHQTLLESYMASDIPEEDWPSFLREPFPSQQITESRDCEMHNNIAP